MTSPAEHAATVREAILFECHGADCGECKQCKGWAALDALAARADELEREALAASGREERERNVAERNATRAQAAEQRAERAERERDEADEARVLLDDCQRGRRAAQDEAFARLDRAERAEARADELERELKRQKARLATNGFDNVRLSERVVELERALENGDRLLGQCGNRRAERLEAALRDFISALECSSLLRDAPSFVLESLAAARAALGEQPQTCVESDECENEWHYWRCPKHHDYPVQP